MRAGFEEGCDVGRDHHCGQVLGGEVLFGFRDAVTLEQVYHRMQQGNRVAVAVPGETRDETIADKLVVPAALQQRDVLDARGPGRRGHGGQRNREGEPSQELVGALHDWNPFHCCLVG